MLDNVGKNYEDGDMEDKTESYRNSSGLCGYVLQLCTVVCTHVAVGLKTADHHG